MNGASAEILLFLALSPGSKYARNEIKEKTGLNNVPLDGALSELLMFKLIKSEKKLYFINLENNLSGQIFNETKEKIGSLPLKVQFILLDFISAVSKFRGMEKIILFGSYAKLIYSDKSDVDIALVFDNDNSKKNAEKKISIFAEKISRKYKKEIQEHFFIEDDLKHKEDPLIKDILRNGRVLI